MEEENKKITTIKLSEETKLRLDKLKAYRRETYDESIKKALDLLNLCKANPLQARRKLLILDKQHNSLNKVLS